MDDVEAALDQVGRRRRLGIGHRRGLFGAAAGDALDPQPAHQSRDALAADMHVVVVGQIELDSRRFADTRASPRFCDQATAVD